LVKTAKTKEIQLREQEFGKKSGGRGKKEEAFSLGKKGQTIDQKIYLGEKRVGKETERNGEITKGEKRPYPEEKKANQTKVFDKDTR